MRETAYDPLRRKLWGWVISANNGYGGDVDDLIEILNWNGWDCPEDLEETD